MRPSAILIGLAAGAASALLFAGLVLQSTTAVGLSLAAPIPIAIASLGWGSFSGFLAAAAAAAVIAAVTSSIPSGVTLFASMALPMAIAGHLAGLARPAATPVPVRNGAAAGPALDWYPLERILFAITLSVIAACLFIGWFVGFDPEEIGPALSAALSQEGVAGIDPATQDQIAELSRIIVDLVPFIQPAALVATLVAGLYLGALVVRISGRLPRPKDDVPSAASLPKIALAIFALGIAGSFMGGTLGLASSVVAGGFGAAFTLVGLAVIHRLTRGRPARGLILFTAYAALLLLTFPLVAFAALGIYETARRPARPATGR